MHLYYPRYVTFLNIWFQEYNSAVIWFQVSPMLLQAKDCRQPILQEAEI